MAAWHLDILERSLLAKGWRITPDLEDRFCWHLSRGGVRHLLAFGPLDDRGRDLATPEQSYQCSVAGRAGADLYFYRRASPRWLPELHTFLAALDDQDSRPDGGAALGGRR